MKRIICAALMTCSVLGIVYTAGAFKDDVLGALPTLGICAVLYLVIYVCMKIGGYWN